MVVVYCCTLGSYNAPFTGPENLELFGITFHNGNSDRFCLCTLYGPPTCHHSSCITRADCFFVCLFVCLFVCFCFFCLFFVCLFFHRILVLLYTILIGSFNVNVLDTNSPLYHIMHDILTSFNLQ